jgi:hypothetical protein
LIATNITQDHATGEQLAAARDQMKVSVFERVANGHRVFTVSNGIALRTLLQIKVHDELSLNEVHATYTDSAGDVRGFIPYLQDNHPNHAEFAIKGLRMFRNEQVRYLTQKQCGPCLHKADGGGYISARDFDPINGCFRDSFSCEMLALGNHQPTLDIERECQAYFVGALAKEVYDATKVRIGFLNERVGAGRRTGYHPHLCATS